MAVKTIRLNIKGMYCSGCEKIIEGRVAELAGVLKVKASYSEQTAEIRFNNDFIQAQTIQQSITALGYEINRNKVEKKPILLSILIFLGLLLAVGGITLWGKSQMPGLLAQINAQMSHLMIFGIGFLTGFHCIGMCGGFIVGYSSRTMTTPKAIISHLAFGFGKTASYSAIGAAFGLLGAVITITPHMRGVAALAASVFLLLYGLRMLNLIPGLQNFYFRLPGAFKSFINNNMRTQSSPLLIGILTGFLLGCGPLQAMYIMAAGTGSPQEGATILFYFSLGTLVPLLGFGAFASLLSRHTIHELVRVSGVLVFIMGIMMANRGLKMIDSGYDFNSLRVQLQQTIDPNISNPAGIK